MPVPFNKPFLSGQEMRYIAQAYKNHHLGGDGDFTKRCQAWLELRTGCVKALLTHSCTAALEMAAILLDVQPGDEIIMPSYTFVSTANAFVLRGATPVFVDIRGDTLNIDETLIEGAINQRTKAIIAVHYAGVACAMREIMNIAERKGLVVIEDAAQGIVSSYHGRALGSIGHLGCISFHESKNIVSGEGGALLVNDSRYSERAEFIREKGTDRSKFLRGHVDKYTWIDIGSSFLPAEIIAAFLAAQLEAADAITQKRIALWDNYHKLLEPLERMGHLRRPRIPHDCQHNGHIYYVILSPSVDRREVIDVLQERGVEAVFHYVPLHSSPAGLRYGRVVGTLPVTDSVSANLLRLPLWHEMTDGDQEKVASALAHSLRGRSPGSAHSVRSSGRAPGNDLS